MGLLQIAKGALKHWKLLYGSSVVLRAHAQDENILGVVANDFKTVTNLNQQKDETLIGATGRAVVDTATTKGTTDKILNGAKQSAEDAGNSVKELQQDVHELSGNVSKLTSGLSGSSDDGGMFSGLSNMFSGITSLFGGGQTGGFNIGSALLLPLAWFTFGKFGWLGKVGALSMLLYGLSHLFSPSKAATQQVVPVRAGGGGQAVDPQAAERDLRKAYDDRANQAGQSEEESYTVRSHK